MIFLKIRAEVDENVVFRMVKVIAELEMVGIVHRPKFIKDYVVKPIWQGYRIV